MQRLLLVGLHKVFISQKNYNFCLFERLSIKLEYTNSMVHKKIIEIIVYIELKEAFDNFVKKVEASKSY